MSAARMRVEVVHPSELGRSDLEVWRSIQEGSTLFDSPFLTPEFAMTCGEVRRSARVAVLDGQGTKGFLPFDQRRRFLARPIGGGSADREALIISGELPHWEDLLRSTGLLVWRFHHLLAHQASVLAPTATTVASPLVDLTHGFERYLSKQVSKNLLKSTGRSARKLEREVGELRFVGHDANHSLVDLLVRWKRDQYARTGVLDVLASPDSRNLLHLLLDRQDDTFTAVLSVLHAGDRPVAVHLGLRTATALAYWLPSYEPCCSRYSPGMILLMGLLRWAAAEGIESVDLGKGDEPYKQRLKSDELLLADGVLAQRLVRKPFGLVHQLRNGSGVGPVGQAAKVLRGLHG